jgi:hypothetical protein
MSAPAHHEESPPLVGAEDVEVAVDNTEPTGPYHRLATIMRSDNNLAIFRRFEDLNIVVLLSLQAEIIELRTLLKKRSKRDEADNPSFSKSFRELNNQPVANAANGELSSRQLLSQISEKMLLYSM